MEALFIGFELPELFHESLIRLSFLSLHLAEFKGIVHAQTEPSHEVHYKGCGAAGLTHGAMHKDTILICIYTTSQLLVVLHDFAVLQLLSVHFKFGHMR